MNATQTIYRGLLLLAALAGMTLGNVAYAQIALRNASSAVSIGIPPDPTASPGTTSKITFVGAGASVVGSGTSLTPVIPADTAVGDFAVLIIAGYNSSDSEPQLAAPSGWSGPRSWVNNMGPSWPVRDLKLATYYRVLAGGDANPVVNLPASYQGDPDGMSAQIAVWRGVDNTTPFDVADATGMPSAQKDWTPPSITTATSAAWVVSVVATNDDNSLGFANAQGFTGRMTGASYDHSSPGNGIAIGLADIEKTTAGATTMPTWRETVNNNDHWAGITFALRPAKTVLTITKPAFTVAGHVLVASVGFRPDCCSQPATNISITPLDDGWTLLRRSDAGSPSPNSLAVYWRLAGDSEPAAYRWSFSVSGGATFRAAAGGILRFADVDQTAPVLGVAESGQTTSVGAQTTPSITTADANTMLVTTHSYASSTTAAWTAPAGMTSPAAVDVTANTLATAMFYGVQALPGATGTKRAIPTPDDDVGNAHILALRSVKAGTALTIPKPSGTVANDVMVASIGVRRDCCNQPADYSITPINPITPPGAGWTLVRRSDNTNGPTNSLAVYIKVAGGAEPDSYTWALSSGVTRAVGGIQSFSGVDPAAPIDVQNGQSTADGLTHATPDVTTSVANTMLVASHTFASSYSWTVSDSLNEAFDVRTDGSASINGQSVVGSYVRQAAVGATGTKSATAAGGSDIGNTHILALRPITNGSTAYDTSTSAGATTGVIKTKIAGSTISLDIIALNAAKNAIATAFTGTVRVEVLNASDNSGALDGDGCRSSWTVIQTLSPDPTFVSGDNGRKTISFTQANSFPEARLRVSHPVGAPTVVGCSGDAFAIRPNQFTSVSFKDNDAQTANTSGPGRTLSNLTVPGGTVHKAGQPFTVRATAVNSDGTTTSTNYAGTATATLADCGATNACIDSVIGITLTIGGSFSAGQLTSHLATYSDVGAVAVTLVDATFANVDAADGSTPFEREIKSSAVAVGRFVPDHFAVTYNTPSFGTACGAGNFTYVGQPFNYTVAPVITVTAQNSANATTLNYTGALWQITNTSLTGKSYTAAGGNTVDATGITGTDPAIADSGAGVGTLTFRTPSFFAADKGFFLTRSTPVAPFDAEVSLAIDVIDADGVAHAANPARFGQASAGNGIAFSSGKSMRFGRLALRNANGSQLVPLRVQAETQYWASSALGFVTNTLDSCTSIANDNVQMSSFTANLAACETAVTGAGTLSAGRKTLLLPAPGNANNGAVLLTVNLGASSSGTTCTSVGGGTVTATGADRSYLQGKWTGTDYDDDPSARAAFGGFKGAEEVIFIRENF